MMTYRIISLLVFCVFVLTPLSLSAQVLNRTIATVNDDAITESELVFQTNLLTLRSKQNESELPPTTELQKQVLERMISEKLQLQQAKELKIEIDENTLNQTIQEMASRDGLSLEQMREFLDDQKISFDDFRDNIKKELTISRLQQQELGPHITISKTDVDNFLNSPEGQDQTGIEYHLGHILLSFGENSLPQEVQKTEKNAKEIIQQLRAGADFAQLAMSKSSGQQALNGGDLGWRKAAELPTLFAKQTPTLQVGEVFGPIRNNNGFHIIKLLDKRANGSTTLKTQFETHVRQILITSNDKTSEKDAQTLLAKAFDQINKGTPFAKMAEKYSQETSSAAKGGDIGWVTEKSVVPEFFQQMTKLRPGEVSHPFKTELGWHLIQVVERKIQQNTSETMRNKAMEVLYQRKFEEYVASWLKRIRQEAEVKIFL